MQVRGTGNFNIPHRLNSDERPVMEAAKKKVRARVVLWHTAHWQGLLRQTQV